MSRLAALLMRNNERSNTKAAVKSSASVLLLTTLLVGTAHADFLPPNDLHLLDSPQLTANITEEEFESLIEEVTTIYQPLAALHDAKIQAAKLWSNSTVNASANQMGKNWVINMYGGLARRPEVTADGFQLVVCHELGHHFGGFPFRPMTWAANEGQSDYFATQSCARQLWSADSDRNAEFALTAHPEARTACDESWITTEERNLCYRIAEAGLSLGTLLAAIGDQKEPDFSTPSEEKVKKTKHTHPKAQCRLDTYLAGAICSVPFNPTEIPGKELPAFNRGNKRAETEAMGVSCSLYNPLQRVASRPGCWFAHRKL
jgi:hypothetical protein